MSMSTVQSYSGAQEQKKIPTPSLASILVGVDGSQSADNALELAVLIAEKYSSKVDLAHIDIMPSQLVGKFEVGAKLQPITPESNSNLIEKSELARTLVMADEALLLERKKSLVSRRIKCQEISVSSSSTDVGAEIVRVCNDGKYDLVVVGSRGLGGVASFVPGSVSRRVATEARCSVLVSKFEIKKIERVLLSYDGSASSRKALALAADLGKRFHAAVNVICVVSTAFIPSGVVLLEAIKRLEEEMRGYSNEASSFLRDGGVVSERALVVGAADVSKAVTEEAEGGFYDLILLGNRGRGEAKSVFLGSTASGVLLDSSRANILIVK